MAALDPNTEKFYIGKYLAEENPFVDKEAYSLPLTEATSFGGVVDNFQALEETSNVEDLLVDPEDFCVDAEDAQDGSNTWGQVNIVATSDEFSGKPIPNFAFYNFYLGARGRGRSQQPTAIEISDFYTVPIESGSPSSRQILEFC